MAHGKRTIISTCGLRLGRLYRTILYRILIGAKPIEKSKHMESTATTNGNGTGNGANITAKDMASLKAEELRTIHVLLTVTQEKALRLLDKFDDRQEIAESCIASRIKGAFKSRAEGAQKKFEEQYDALARTMKLPIAKEEFVKNQMAEVREILRNL